MMRSRIFCVLTSLCLLFVVLSRAGLCGQLTKPIHQLMSSEIAMSQGGGGEFDLNWAASAKGSSDKSTVKAGLLSFVLPGAGEYYLGSKSRAAGFLGAEALIWGGYFSFRTWGNWLKDDYKSYAAEHAGANPSGKDDKYFDRLQFYESRDWFNEIEGERFGYPYPYSDAYYWHWDSSESRKKYRSIRGDSKAAFRNATFVLGVAVINRVVSVADAIRLSKRLKRGDDFEFYGWELNYDARPFGSNPNASLKFVKAIN